MEKQPVAIEVMPSQDRCSIVLLLRSNSAITMEQLIETLQTFSSNLYDRFAKSKIEVAKPKIIVT